MLTLWERDTITFTFAFAHVIDSSEAILTVRCVDYL